MLTRPQLAALIAPLETELAESHTTDDKFILDQVNGVIHVLREYARDLETKLTERNPDYDPISSPDSVGWSRPV